MLDGLLFSLHDFILQAVYCYLLGLNDVPQPLDLLVLPLFLEYLYVLQVEGGLPLELLLLHLQRLGLRNLRLGRLRPLPLRLLELAELLFLDEHYFLLLDESCVLLLILI